MTVTAMPEETKKKTTKKKSAAKKKTTKKKSTGKKASGEKATTKKSTAKNLVIVESPTKTKSISKYLGSDYEVTSSKGHIIDLPKSQLGIDLDHNYEPLYEPMHGKKTVVKDLQKLAKDAEVIYLATDLDREGEAISWHVVSALGGLDENGRIKDGKKFKRVVFAEITKNAILSSFEHPRDLDYNLIDAYQARRVLDRLVGYKLSPLLWKKIQYGLSAGRVQSVATRLIVTREEERKKFKSTTYYRLFANLKAKEEFQAELDMIDEKNIGRKHTINLFAGDYTYGDTVLNTEEVLQSHMTVLKEAKELEVIEASGRESSRKPQAPFTTASLQRAGQTYLHTTAKNTMRMAQRLYEEGHITYHRTDSTNLSADFLASARQFIKDEYGDKYLYPEERTYKSKGGAQEAHEAIRPTSVENLADKKLAIKSDLGEKEMRLYELIWQRALASQASDAVYRNDTIVLKPIKKLANDYTFTAKGSVILFEGHLKIYGRRGEDTILPDLVKGDVLPVSEYTTTDHETSPPPRYNEASLIRELEAHEIGRPSTYAPTIDTIQARGYAIKENSAFVPEDIGIAVTHLLIDHFPEIVDLDFTAGMENQFDVIADGKEQWQRVIGEFYQPFEKVLEKKEEEIDREDYKVLEVLDEKCPECGHNVQLKLGRYGKFYSCGNFPECKYAKPFVDKIGMNCPDCKDGEIITRRTRFGKKFFGCTNYPKCEWASWKDPRLEEEE